MESRIYRSDLRMNGLKINIPLERYHPSSELITIINEPTFTSERIPALIGEINIAKLRCLPTLSQSNWHSIHYDLIYIDYHGKLEIERGTNKNSRSIKPHLITRSSVTVGEMIEEHLPCCVHILLYIFRDEIKCDTDCKITSYERDVYQFEPDGKRIVEEFALKQKMKKFAELEFVVSLIH